MLVDEAELVRFCGGDGKVFQTLLHRLVVSEARRCGISPTDIDFDHRITRADGGRDIVVRAGNGSESRGFIPAVSSIWSAKAGDDGVRPDKLKSELCREDRQDLIADLRRGLRFVWCAAKPIDQDKRIAMRQAADELIASCSLPSDAIDFRWVDGLATILNDHPNVIAEHLPSIRRAFEGVLHFRDWKRDVPNAVASQWVNFEGRDDIKLSVRSHLLSKTSPNVLHIAGLSGVGKTRTVLEACRDEPELAGTLYVPVHDDQSVKPLLGYLKAPGRHARVVLDEVPVQKLGAFLSEVSDYRDRLRFVTVGPLHVGGTTGRFGGDVIVVPEPGDGMAEVLQIAGNGLAEEVLQSIAALSQHDLRLALLLVEATRRQPDLRTVPLGSIGEVLDRIHFLFASRLGDKDQFLKRFGTLVTCIDVGRSGRHRAELTYLAHVRGIPEADLDDMIASRLWKKSSSHRVAWR